LAVRKKNTLIDENQSLRKELNENQMVIDTLTLKMEEKERHLDSVKQSVVEQRNRSVILNEQINIYLNVN